MLRLANVALLQCLLCSAITAVAHSVDGGRSRSARDAERDEGSLGLAFLGRLQDSLPHVATAVVTHTLKMENYLGVQYIAPITLGNQALRAVYDTGSFDIMAVATACAVCKSSVRAYNNGTSGTYASGGKAWEPHYYVSGKVVAKQDFETVRIGDPASPLVVRRSPFWQVMDTDIEVWTKDRARFTAIVGLGHADTVPNADGTPSSKLSLLSRVDAQRFAICLERGPQNPGWLTINPQMSAATQSLYRTVPIVGNNHWASPLVGFQVGRAQNLCEGRNVAIVDSGTSMLGVPSAAIVAMAELIDEIQTDCSNLEDLPDMTFRLGQHSFTLPPSAYVLKVSSEISDGTVFNSCIPAFMPIDMSTSRGNVWILGMPFLRHHYTVFDRVGKSLHIADQGENCQPVKEEFQTFNLVNPHGLAVPKAKTKRTLPSPPTLADVRAAMRPMWARGVRNGTLLQL
mmetsp:Transcript_17219/g.45628  ORF Transcript_17219/g.45628 Transcript_17219/m.45628 type:complete len:457 (-) Transcript_17219:195-1565(-)